MGYLYYSFFTVFMYTTFILWASWVDWSILCIFFRSWSHVALSFIEWWEWEWRQKMYFTVMSYSSPNNVGVYRNNYRIKYYCDIPNTKLQFLALTPQFSFKRKFFFPFSLPRTFFGPYPVLPQRLLVAIQYPPATCSNHAF